MLIAAAIDTSLAGNNNITRLGPYGAVDAGVEIICCRKTFYVPAPYVVLLLCADLSPLESWNRLCRSIVDTAAEAACRPLFDWIRTVIVRSGPNTHSTLVVTEPSAPLPDALLLQHRHRLFLSHLPGIDPSINRAAGTRVAETVREVAVELRDTRLENKRVIEKKYNKGVTEYFGANLAHLLNLVQLTDSKDLPHVWEALARASKHHPLLVLQGAFDTATEDMELRAPTIATPSLLNLVLALGFRMEIRDELTTEIHPFFLGQHTETVRKFLRIQVDRYAMMASGAGAPSLADVEILSAPDGITLPRNFSMARGQLLRSWLIVRP